ncbi:adhesion G-protein coupled receptor G2-like isoform X2 [Electrophorus electricus]|uniref:adhesion G-protein coupled receptor G2-like isoform X2 n=1 Tax=Electrophorus electricus TaxID=8005 RepID=UPI0015CF855E|nr:adhesion G-protein coupled receptor G2-like isoform X2 [Electrophorus electricus]
MVNTALCGCHDRQQKVLSHVLLSVLVLLAYLGVTTMTTAMTSKTTASTPTSGPGITYQRNMSSTVINNTTMTKTSITQRSSNFTSGSTNPTNTSSNITTMLMTSTDTTSFYSPTASTPTHCNFSQQCDDHSVYYWMTISVEVTGTFSDEAKIAMWLQQLFREKLGKCNSSTSLDSNNMGMLSSGASVQSNSSLTTVHTPENSVRQIGTTTNLLKNIEVMCDIKTSNETQCNVVLQLTQEADQCCIVSIVDNSTVQAHVVGDKIEKVAKGLCVMNATASPAGNFEKCNGFLTSGSFCNSNVAVNISCSGQSGTVYVSQGIQHGRNCSSSAGNSVNPINTCSCTAYCNSPAAYYTMNITIVDSSFNITQIGSLISHPKPCNTEIHKYINTIYTYFLPLTLGLILLLKYIPVSTFSSGCLVLHNISKMYDSFTVQCGPQPNVNNCTVILKLTKAVDTCSVGSALLTAFQNESAIHAFGIVTRVAKSCISENRTNIDPIQLNMESLVYFNLTLYDICKVNLDRPLGSCMLPPEVCHLVITINQTTIQNVTTTLTPTVVNATLTTNTTNLNTTASTTSAEAAAEALKNMSKNVLSLSFAQIEDIMSQLEQILAHSPNVSLNLGTSCIDTVSNLLDASPNTLAPLSKRIIRLVDTVGLKLVVQSQMATILAQSLALAVKKVDGTAFPQTTFTMIDSSDLQIDSGRRRRRNTETRFLSPQGSVLLPASLTKNLTTQEQQMASRVQFNFYQKSTLFQDKALNPNKSMLISGVLSASVANLSISNLTDNIVITLRNTKSSMSYTENYTLSCVFWDFYLNGGAGGWSPEGCKVMNRTANETVCSCNHLTGFGVLLNIFQEGPPNPLQALILSYITYIGCGISAIFLSITLLTYLSFEKLRKDTPSKILIHLCLALLMLNLVFLLDSWLALYANAKGLCISTAFFLHYFLLASFTWMALEAVHMYIVFVKVFNTYVSRFMVKLGFAGWGIPLVVVIIVIATDENNYGLVSYGKVDNEYTNDFCWLKSEIAFYVGVVVYFCVVFLMNLTMFIVVMVQLCRIKRQNPHSVQYRSSLQQLRSVAGLTVLLGLTWGFAFFAWGVLNLPFMYLFAIFNSLQGFFIFVLHCAVKENVRRQWRTYLCCGKFRLPENSEWSHTATQKNKKSSVNRFATSFRSVQSSKSNHSSSSTTFLVSDSSGADHHLGISNPYDDRAITAQEEHSLDVILNEINHRHRGQRLH